MVEYSKNIVNQNEVLEFSAGTENKYSNPLAIKSNINFVALTEYVQEQEKAKYDKDVVDVVEVVRILNNLAPIRMPIYNFNINEINGDAYYKPDGSLLLIREYDNDLIRDYYAVPMPDVDEFSVARILEHDKVTGRLRAKIEPITRQGSKLKSNITIFDAKVNNKYTLIQLVDDGVVSNISEFSGKGKSFQTLFRNTQTFKPARYIEGKETKEYGFVMQDCLFNDAGNLVKIKRFSNKKEVCIDYTDDKKNISVKNK